uniref:Uncharacterized protein n=1 Tax=Eutreptiella gymnastica TaxID=73025 RepID=A0A7S4G5C6_9EUGL
MPPSYLLFGRSAPCPSRVDRPLRADPLTLGPGLWGRNCLLGGPPESTRFVTLGEVFPPHTHTRFEGNVLRGAPGASLGHVSSPGARCCVAVVTEGAVRQEKRWGWAMGQLGKQQQQVWTAIGRL